MRRTQPFLYWGFCLLFSLFAPFVWAQTTLTWTGKGDSTSWTDKENWNPAAVPSTDDTVIINLVTDQPYAVKLPATAVSIRSLQLASSSATLRAIAPLTINTLQFSAGSLTGEGSNNPFTSISSSFAWSGGTFSNIDLAVFGTATLSGSLVSIHSMVNFSSATTLDTGTAWVLDGANVEFYQGDLNIKGDVSLAPSPNTSKTPRISFGGRTFKSGKGTASFKGDLSVSFGAEISEGDLQFVFLPPNFSNIVYLNGNYAIAAGAALSLIGYEGMIAEMSFGSFTGSGDLRFFNVNDCSLGDDIFSQTPFKGTVEVNNSTLRLNGKPNKSIGQLNIQNETSSVITAQALALENLNLMNGKLALGGDLAVAAQAIFIGGTLSGSAGNKPSLKISGNAFFSTSATDTHFSNTVLETSGKTSIENGIQFIAGSTWNNLGDAVWQGGNLKLESGLMTNQGNLSIRHDGTLSKGTDGSFHNSGRIDKQAGTGSATIQLKFVNQKGQGELGVNAGTLAFTDKVSNEALMFGTSAFSFATELANTGLIRPGTFGVGYPNPNKEADVGALNILGEFTNGTLDIVLKDTQTYDKLNLSSSFLQTGLINVVLFEGFDPPVGSQFAILSYKSTSGSNATLNLPSLAGGKTWKNTYSANTLVLEVIGGNTNQPPLATADTYTTEEDQTLKVTAPGVLHNDSDPNADKLTAILGKSPNSGTLTLNQDGAFSYTPNLNFFGTDTFTYFAHDGKTTSKETAVSIEVKAVNDPPVGTADTYQTNEDIPLSITTPSLLDNDTDAENDPLQVFDYTQPTNGTVAIQPNGSFVYTPQKNFNGKDSFTYNLGVNLPFISVSITVVPVNDPPVALDDQYTTEAGSTLTIQSPGILENDSDVEGSTLVPNFLKQMNGSEGVVQLQGGGGFIFTPASLFTGKATFTYKVTDSGGTDSNEATVTITVTQKANTPPVAQNDNYQVNEDTELKIEGLGILGNDTDAEKNTLSAVLVEAPLEGTLKLDPNGAFSYLPKANFHGKDRFTYQAFDGKASSNLATVSITILPVNDPPKAEPDTYQGEEDTPISLAAKGVLRNDTDPENDPLTAVLMTPPTKGQLVLKADGSFIYTPHVNQNGQDQFSYKANDGVADSQTTTVTLQLTPVNDPPISVEDRYQTSEDLELNVSIEAGLLANDRDPEQDPLTVTLVQAPTKGVLTLLADGSLRYKPNLNENGTDTFSYKANDGTLSSNTQTVTIEISPVNDAPTAKPEAYVTSEDQPLVVSGLGVLANDGDVDGDALLAIKVSDPIHGRLSLSAEGGFTYTPNTHYFGTDSFSYKAHDGKLDSEVTTVSIAIHAVNDPPSANDDQYAVQSGSTLDIAAAGVLANDTDIESSSLTATKATDPQNGSLVLNVNGSFSYKPNANFIGTDTFTYTASDGTASSAPATVTINVSEKPNTPPTAFADTYETNEDQILTIAAKGVLTNDTDADNDVLTAKLVASPTHGHLTLNADGSFTYTPNANYFGSDHFTYQANDGKTNSETVSVSLQIRAVNDPPVASNDSYTTEEDTPLSIQPPGILANDHDLDSSSLLIRIVENSSKGSLRLEANGGFTYTPHENINGNDQFTYALSDGEAVSNTATVFININAVNDPPVAHPDTYTATAGLPLIVQPSGVLANDTDPENTPLKAILVSPSNGALTLNENGGFTYTASVSFTGPDTFTYKANDGSADAAPTTVTINVNPSSNSLPIAHADTYTAVEDTPLQIASTQGVLRNDTDAENDPLTVVNASDPPNGSLSMNPNGSFIYTPDPNFSGTDRFTYSANDGNGSSSPATVTITVIAVNDPPSAVDDVISVNEDTSLLFEPLILANDRDADGDHMTITQVTTPSFGSTTPNGQGQWIYTPNPNFNGKDAFSYTITDGFATASATVTVNVISILEPPIVLPETYTLNEDQVLNVPSLGVLANDTDPDGDALIAEQVSAPNAGSLVFNANGSFTYTPNLNFNGTDQFLYRVFDGTYRSIPITVTLQVAPINDPPTLEQPANISLLSGAGGTITLTGLSAGGGPDEAAQPLSLRVSTNNPSLIPESSLTLGPIVNGRADLSFQSIAGQTGNTLITIILEDGQTTNNTRTVTFTITIIPKPNQKPIAKDDGYTTPEDTPLNIADAGILSNDADADGDVLTAIIATQPSHGSLLLNPKGGFVYTPHLDFAGTDQFTYRANDGIEDSELATVNILVQGLNDPPKTQPDTYTILEDATLEVKAAGVLENDLDPENTPLKARLGQNPAQGSLQLNADGSFIYKPKANFNGADSFTYFATDGNQESKETQVNIQITPVNDPPKALADVYTTTFEQTLVISLPGVLGNDTDPDKDPLTVKLITNVSHGTLNLSEKGSFVYIPPAGFSGIDRFTYVAMDATALSEPVEVTLLVLKGDNQTPTAKEDAYLIHQGETLSIAPPGILANDSDPDQNTLQAVLSQTVSQGRLELQENGGFTYTPNAAYFGKDQFTYRAKDALTVSNEAKVEITVNAKPIANADTATTTENQSVIIPILANDTDADDGLDQNSVIIVSPPTQGRVVINPFDGSLTYTPQQNSIGNDALQYTVRDKAGANSQPAQVSITITRGNRLPIAQNDAVRTNMNLPLKITVLANDSDPDSDPLQVTQTSTPNNGTTTINSDFTITYTPNRGVVNITDQFFYTISDGKGGMAAATVAVTIDPIQYRIQTLGSLGGATRAFAINDRGQIVGISYNREGKMQAFYADDTNIKALGSATPSQAFGLSESGHITGLMQVGDHREGVLWTTSGNETLLGHLGGKFSVGYGVNASGAVVGASITTANQMHAISYTNKLIDLHTFGDQAHSEAYDLNLGGEVIGLVHNGTGLGRAALNGLALAGAADSRAYRVNNLGQIVGSAQTGGIVTPQIWSRGTFTPLLSLGGGFAEAYGMNDAGWVVGASTAGTGKTETAYNIWSNDPTGRDTPTTFSSVWVKSLADTRAVLWLDGRVFDLNTLIPKDTGWFLTEARDINNLGQIVGYGTFNGQIRAFLLTPLSNKAPEANSEEVVFISGQATYNVLANDRDSDGDPLQLVSVIAPKNIQVQWTKEGVIHFQMAQPLRVTETLTYIVSDGNGATQTAQLTIKPSPYVATDEEILPHRTALQGSYPNPFNPSTSIRYELAETSHVRLEVFDTMGRKITTLVNHVESAGLKTIRFEAQSLPAGLYFYRLIAGKTIETKAFTLVK